MSYQDRMGEDADWKEGMNAFREDTQDRMLALLDQINELELIIEELTNTTKPRPKKS